MPYSEEMTSVDSIRQELKLKRIEAMQGLEKYIKQCKETLITKISNSNNNKKKKIFQNLEKIGSKQIYVNFKRLTMSIAHKMIWTSL